MPSFIRPVLTLCALAASAALWACADGTDRSLAQAPIYFGSAGQTFGPTPGATNVSEPDSRVYIGLGGDALLPATVPTEPLVSVQTSAAAASTGLAYTTGVDGQAGGGDAAAASIATPLAGAAASIQAGGGSGVGADLTLASPIAGAAVQVAAAPSAPEVTLSTTGSLLGGVNRLAVNATTVVTPIGPNLVANGASTVRRACVLRLGC
jgi:hypothetical protein